MSEPTEKKDLKEFLKRIEKCEDAIQKLGGGEFLK